MGFARALSQLVLVGVGIGALETLVNVTVSERRGSSSAKPLLFVHSAATLGAMLTPFAIALARPDWTTTFHITGGAALLVVAVAFAKHPNPMPLTSAGRMRPQIGPLLPFLVMGFAYVGVEATLTLFAVPYASGALSLTEARGRDAIGFFWSGLLVGRIGLMLVPRPIGPGFLVAAGLAGAAILLGGIGARLHQVELVFAAAGLAMGFVFPVMIALTSDRFPDSRGTATGLVAGAAALGGFVVPWLSGALGDRIGIGPALASLGFWCIGFACAALVARRGHAA